LALGALLGAAGADVWAMPLIAPARNKAINGFDSDMKLNFETSFNFDVSFNSTPANEML